MLALGMESRRRRAFIGLTLKIYKGEVVCPESELFKGFFMRKTEIFRHEIGFWASYYNR